MAKRPCHEGTEKAKEIRGLRVPSAHQFIIHGMKDLQQQNYRTYYSVLE